MSEQGAGRGHDSHGHDSHGSHGHDPHGHDHGHEEHNDIVYPEAIPFVLVHLSLIGIFWTGFTTTAVVMCVTLYLVRMWAIVAGYHRYFSHRSFKTSRAFQFVLALVGQMSSQRGALWWAALHRHHHRHSDTPLDIHSPRHTGFWFSHVGWIFSPQKNEADYSDIEDFARFPELRFLDRHPYLPAILLGVACFLIGGWPGLFVGFMLSTVLLWHGVFFINSLAHVVGTKRYVTGDDSRNNWWLALITLGEGWHNNHHHYQSSTRQGFFWWEIDIAYYSLRMLSWVGVVWDLREPPKHVVAGEARLGRKVIEKVAEDWAEDFSVDALVARMRDAWDSLPSVPSLEELRVRSRQAQEDVLAYFHEVELPHVPSIEEIHEELRSRVAKRYRDSPSLMDVAERARAILIARLAERLVLEPRSA